MFFFCETKFFFLLYNMHIDVILTSPWSPAIEIKIATYKQSDYHQQIMGFVRPNKFCFAFCFIFWFNRLSLDRFGLFFMLWIYRSKIWLYVCMRVCVLGFFLSWCFFLATVLFAVELVSSVIVTNLASKATNDSHAQVSKCTKKNNKKKQTTIKTKANSTR